MDRAAFSADYVDLKFIKSRKVAQIVVEIAIEQSADFVAQFGTPNPACGVPVALARLHPEKPASEAPKLAEPMPKERRRFDTLPLPQQAAMRCNEPAFRRFLAEQNGITADEVMNSDMAASLVRIACGVETRADIRDEHPSGLRWRALEAEYSVWMRAPV